MMWGGIGHVPIYTVLSKSPRSPSYSLEWEVVNLLSNQETKMKLWCKVFSQGSESTMEVIVLIAIVDGGSSNRK